MMKKWILILVAFLSSCAVGFKYQQAPPLSFSDLEYGYPVKFTGDNPKIAYYEAGKPESDKTLILIHGLASDAGFFKTIVPALAKEYRVIVVDLPGYGHSEKGDFPYGMKWYAEQIQKLIKSLSLKNITLSGHSMGGQIAMTYALNWPNDIQDLILLSPAGVEPFLPGEGKWLSSVITLSSTVKATEEHIRINLSRNFYRWSDDFEWMVEERVRLAKSEQEFLEFAYTVDKCVDAMLNEPTTEKLKNITVPVKIIFGKHDGLIPNPYLHPGFTSAVFEKTIGVIPNVKLIEIPKAGHMLQIEQPDAVVNAILTN